MAEIIEKGWEVQRRIEERLKRMGKGKYGRILRMARKPTSDEFSKVIIITGIGLVAIGALGFLIYYIMRYGGSFFSNLFGMI
jgi:protein transport protein SEC61 subunit gamma-like protein